MINYHMTASPNRPLFQASLQRFQVLHVTSSRPIPLHPLEPSHVKSSFPLYTLRASVKHFEFHCFEKFLSCFNKSRFFLHQPTSIFIFLCSRKSQLAYHSHVELGRGDRRGTHSHLLTRKFRRKSEKKEKKARRDTNGRIYNICASFSFSSLFLQFSLCVERLKAFSAIHAQFDRNRNSSGELENESAVGRPFFLIFYFFPPPAICFDEFVFGGEIGGRRLKI